HQLVYPTLMDDVKSVRDGGPRVEVEVRSKDNRWYFVRLLPYRVGGDIQGVVVTLIDATALASAKARTRQLSAIVDSSADAIIGLSLEGTVLTWNPAATRLYGYNAAEILGHSIFKLIPEAEHEATKAVLADVASGADVINAPAIRRSEEH